jgi:hyperosmotically inducible periplasmic protein
MLEKVRLLILTFVLVAAAACTQSNAPVKADNTAQNADSPAAQTPVDQAENAADLQISQEIRKSIVADDSLSLDAHNVKVITSAGVVTLRGPVKSQQEKTAIEAKAKQAAGVTRVDSFLEVK